MVGGVGTHGREPAGQSCGEQEAGGEVFGPVLPAEGKPGRVRGAGFGWKTAPVPSGGTPQPCWPCTQSATVWSSSCAGGDGHLQAESRVRRGECNPPPKNISVCGARTARRVLTSCARGRGSPGSGSRAAAPGGRCGTPGRRRTRPGGRSWERRNKHQCSSTPRVPHPPQSTAARGALTAR